MIGVCHDSPVWTSPPVSSPESFSTASLNREQRQAVVHKTGPQAVFAGAGTGKTRVITTRIAHLVKVRQVPATSILAVTFTNKAAREMRERVTQLIGNMHGKGPTVSTFHSLCVHILRQDGEAIDLPSHFSIYGEPDQRSLMRSMLTEAGTDDSSPAEILAEISLAKNRLQTPETFPVTDAKSQFIQDLYARYQKLLASMDAVDFDDLLLHTIRLFSLHGHVKVGWQRRYPHILVDEFQDTNTAQYKLLTQLWDGNGSLTVVGDDDQAIYTWRGAEADMFRRFTDDYKDARTVILSQNYRSTSTILDAAGEVIGQIKERVAKNLWSELGQGRKIGQIIGSDPDDEAKQVVESLNLARYAGAASPGDFAILIRTNLQSRPFEAALREARLPYVVVGATGFFDRTEIRDLTSYLRFLQNENDEAALRRILNTPRRGIGAASLAAAARFSTDQGIGLLDALDQASRIDGVSTGAVTGIRQFIDMTAELRFAFAHNDLVEALEQTIRVTGLEAHWTDTSDHPRQAEARLNGARELVGMLSRYVTRELDPTLTGFLTLLSLLDRMEDEEKADGRVTIITLHAAKGLEYKNVYLAGMEEGLLPHSRNLEEDGKIAEERRLAYVGITRARQRLTLSRAITRKRYGEKFDCTPSRFLADIPPSLLATEEEEPEGPEEELAKNFFAGIKDMFD